MMTRRGILKSFGAVVLPSMLMLSGCPQQCAPDAPAPAAAPVAPAAAAPAAAASAPPPAGSQFTATFDSPTEFSTRFVTSVGNYVDAKGRRVGDLIDCCPNIETPHTFPGDHDANCDGPTTQRTIDVHDIKDFFWYSAPGGDASKGHVMTAFDDTGLHDPGVRRTRR